MITQKYLKSFIKSLYRFLTKNPKLSFTKLRGCTGLIEYDEWNPKIETTIISLDYRKDILPSLVHEFLHYRHPDWCERKVERVQVQIISKMSSRQMKNMLKRLADAL